MFQIDRRLLQNISWSFILLSFILTAFGLIEIYSATFTYNSFLYFKKQLIWWGIGICGMIFFMCLNYQILKEYAYVIYFITLILLILVLIIGKKSMGAQRWLNLGFINFQPSELLKLTTIIIIAKFFDEAQEVKNYSLIEILKPLIMVLIPVLLVIKQPDLGSGLLILFVATSMFLFVGIKKSSIIKIITFSILFIPFSWHFLKDYQKKRILTFIFPERDPLGAGYHIIQSKIAIGSGKLFGKGYLKGTQNKLAFLPEHHTDFIFSVIGEELGFIGCVLLIFIFFLFLLKGFEIAKNSKDTFGALLVVGIMFLFFWQFFINIGMVMGLLPVVGIPLPFISYGGTSLFISYCLVGLVLNVNMRRFIF